MAFGRTSSLCQADCRVELLDAAVEIAIRTQEPGNDDRIVISWPCCPSQRPTNCQDGRDSSANFYLLKIEAPSPSADQQQLPPGANRPSWTGWRRSSRRCWNSRNSPFPREVQVLGQFGRTSAFGNAIPQQATREDHEVGQDVGRWSRGNVLVEREPAAPSLRGQPASGREANRCR